MRYNTEGLLERRSRFYAKDIEKLEILGVPEEVLLSVLSDSNPDIRGRLTRLSRIGRLANAADVPVTVNMLYMKPGTLKATLLKLAMEKHKLKESQRRDLYKFHGSTKIANELINGKGSSPGGTFQMLLTEARAKRRAAKGIRYRDKRNRA